MFLLLHLLYARGRETQIINEAQLLALCCSSPGKKAHVLLVLRATVYLKDRHPPDSHWKGQTFNLNPFGPKCSALAP